jgi:hypothetical protein
MDAYVVARGPGQKTKPKNGPMDYPRDHEPAMRVPKGGSSCSSCEYLGKDGETCRNKYYIRWHGSNKLGAPADEFCSDWYEPQGGE